MPRQPILAGERMSRTLSGWLVAAVCIILADTANAAMSGRSSGSAQRQPIASRLPDTAFQSDAAIFSRDNTKVAGSGARSRGQIALDLHRIRTRRPFQGTLRTDSDNASDDGIHLNLCGVIVAPPEAPPPFIFLSAETTRGPPRAGAQSPRLFDGARDRPAPHPCASFRSPGYPLHESSSARRATCPPIRTSVADKVSALGVAAGLSTKQNPTVHPQDQPEVQPSLTNSQNNTKES